MAGSDNSFFIGPQVKENSFPVTIATDQLPLPVQLTATPTIDIGNVDQGLPGDISSAWPILVTDGIDVLGTPANPFRIDPTGSTIQPVSGSVAVINFPVSQLVDQGSAALLPGAWPVEITDGFAVLGTPTDPLRTDPTGSTTQPVSGSITALQGSPPWSMNLTEYGSVATTLGQKPLASSVPVTMAVDQRPGLSDLTGSNKTFSVSVEVNMPSAGTDNPLLLLRNPAGSGKILHIVKIKAGTQVSNVSAAFKIFANPTVTVNGTSQTPRTRNVGGGSSAVALTTTTPTITVMTEELESSIQGQNSNSAALIDDYDLLIQSGNAVVLTGNPLSNNRLAKLTIVWMEL